MSAVGTYTSTPSEQMLTQWHEQRATNQAKIKELTGNLVRLSELIEDVKEMALEDIEEQEPTISEIIHTLSGLVDVGSRTKIALTRLEKDTARLSALIGAHTPR